MADEGITRIIKLDVNATQGLRELEKLNKTTKSVDDSVTKLTKGFDSMRNILGTIGTAFAAFQGVKLFTDATDQINNLRGSFEALLGSAERSKTMMGELFAVVNTTGGSLDDVGKSMQRLAVAFSEVGGTEAQIAQVAENFIKLGRIGGSNMADATEGLRQFGQAMASGTLQGDELRSILERVPKVAQEIAKEMKVPVADLKKMGAEGKITGDILANALLRNTQEIAAAFEKMPVTMEQAWNKVVSAGTQTLATLDSMMGISKTIAIMFSTIGNILESVNTDLKSTEGATSAIAVAATAVGNAFKGIVIVVGALTGAIAALLTGTQAWARIILAISQGNLSEAWDIGKEAVTNMKSIAVETGNFAHNIAMGEAPIKKNAAAVRDWEKGLDSVTGKLKKTKDEAGKGVKVKAPDMSDWDKWIKSLDEAVKKALDLPKQIVFLEEAIKNLDTSTAAGAARLEVYSKALEDMKPPTAASTALKTLRDEIDKLAGQPQALKALEDQMQDLVDVGAEGTREFTATAKAIREIRAAMDESGGEKAVQDVEDLIKAGQNLQAQFDAINKAVSDGRIPQAWADNWKDAALQVDNETKKTKDTIKSVGDQLAETGKKFTEDFADKLVDSLGETEFAIDDWANEFLKAIAKIMVNQQFQNFIKLMGTYFANSGTFEGFMAAPQGSAKGNAWTSSKVEFMAQGGILNSPMLFRNGRRLAVAGEAGAEAVMPLARTANGDLGVRAAGGGDTINIYNNNASNNEVSTKTTDNSDGTKQIDVYIEAKVKGMFSSGKMDRTMSGSYGLTRQPSRG